jgi:hypothetical protein
VHQSKYSALFFSLNSGHRFSHPESPFPCLYLAADIHTCLFERFGDQTYANHMAIAESIWNAHSLSRVQVPLLNVCDLTSSKTLSSLKVDLSTLMHHDLALPQEWGLALQRHPAGFQGIQFRSRLNGKRCLVLFKREGLEKRLRDTILDTLPNQQDAVDWLDKHEVSLF